MVKNIDFERFKTLERENIQREKIEREKIERENIEQENIELEELLIRLSTTRIIEQKKKSRSAKILMMFQLDQNLFQHQIAKSTNQK